MTAGSIGVAAFVASVWRICNIVADLRRLDAALVSPAAADPAPLAEGESHR